MIRRSLLSITLGLLPLCPYLAGCSGGTASITPREVSTSPTTPLSRSGGPGSATASSPLSADRRKIALLSEADGHWNLLVMRPEDSTPEVVAKDVLPKLLPAWSRDGWFLYYARAAAETSINNATATGKTFEVLRWSAEKKESLPLGKTEGEALSCLEPSPDGSRIAVMVDSCLRIAPTERRPGGSANEKAAFETIVDDAVPANRFAWSSTSNQLIYSPKSVEATRKDSSVRASVDSIRGSGLMVVSLRDKRKTRFTANQGDRLPVYQNQGSKLLFRRGPDLYLATSDGRFIRKFADNVLGDTVLWSPDDAKVAFLQAGDESSAKAGGGNPTLTVLEATGKAVAVFMLDAKPDAYQFSWSPASNELVLSCSAKDTAQYPVAFFNINTKEHRLAEKFPVAFDVRWF